MQKIITKNQLKNLLEKNQAEIVGIVFHEGYNYLIVNDFFNQITIHCKVCD